MYHRNKIENPFQCKQLKYLTLLIIIKGIQEIQYRSDVIYLNFSLNHNNVTASRNSNYLLQCLPGIYIQPGVITHVLLSLIVLKKGHELKI